jgi:hypothetical protein
VRPVGRGAIASGSRRLRVWSARLRAARPLATWPGVLLVLVLFSAAFFENALAAAHRKPFWHDEIFTILFARLPSLATMWRAARDGLDFMPPLNAVLTHALRYSVGEGPIVTRIPPMIGVWIACLALLAIVRRRSNLALGVCAALLPLWTSAFRYAVEARGYGLMLGFFALSALAWSEAARGNRRMAYLPLLALSLAGGAWSHYYAILNVVPLALGETVRDIRRRAPDWGIWGAFAVAAAFMLPLQPLAGSVLAHTGRSWTLLDSAGIGETYSSLFVPLLDARTLGAAAILTVLGRLMRVTSRDPTDAERIPAHETVAAFATLLIPLAGVVAGRLGVGLFVPRYALSAVVGVVPVALLAVWVGSRRSRAVALAMCAFLTASFAQSTWAARDALRAPYPNPVAERPALTQRLRRGEYVCITGGLMYLQFWYYAPTELKPRLYYLVDPATATRLMGTDSFDNGLLALGRWSGVTAPDYDRFVSGHRRFTVYGAGSGWLLDKLAESGASVRETGVELGYRIYDVALPQPPPMQ